MKWLSLILGGAVWIVAGDVHPARAGGEEVLVIYNSGLPESKSVAEYYAKRRAVPEAQVFGFKLSTGAEMSRAEYRDSLVEPLVRSLTRAGLAKFGGRTFSETNGTTRTERWMVAARFRYAVLCYGVPWRIKRDNGLRETEAETMRPEMRRNEAAVDSELACLSACERPYVLAGPLNNPCYATTNAAGIHPTNGVLMVARLDGPTPEIARGLVDKALAAERDGLWGRAYFDLRGPVDPGLQQGEDWLRGAAEICRELGFATVVDTNESVFPAAFPMSQIAFYAGWYREHACGAFGMPKAEFMPGAFAYHLHSFSAADLRSTSQNWVGPLLAKGATITMGSVCEPYLGGTPDVATFMARLIYQGFSFGEAAYASQSALSWQVTVVGDPLYRPFGRPPSEVHQDLEQRHSDLIAWSHLRLADLNLTRGAPAADVVNYLEEKEETKRSSVLLERLGELYESLGKPTSSAFAYEQALKHAPSPQQRIRLSLALADKLQALNQEADAYAVYTDLLSKSPQYPDKAAIHRRLVALAKKLGKTEDAAKYERELGTPDS